MEQETKPETKNDDYRVTAALAYVFLLFFIPMAKKDSAFCQFHAKQGIVMFVVWVIVSFLAWIPFLGWAAWISMLVLNVMAIGKTLNGEMWEIPYIGKYAKQIKL
jgi:fumarate reductase subunit D